MSSEYPVVDDHIWQGSDRLYLLFGGVLGRLGMNSNEEFSRSAGIFDYSRIFLRDPSRAWYLNGLPGIGANINDLAHYLEKRIKDIGIDDVRFVGNCMGGFAAILLCSMLGRGKAIAFAPQSFLSPEKTSMFEDSRAPHLLKDLWNLKNEYHIYDLPSWIRMHSPKMSADIYVSTDEKHDLIHAQQFEGFKNIKVNYFAQGGHGVLKHLGAQGLLPGILGA